MDPERHVDSSINVTTSSNDPWGSQSPQNEVWEEQTDPVLQEHLLLGGGVYDQSPTTTVEMNTTNDGPTSFNPAWGAMPNVWGSSSHAQVDVHSQQRRRKEMNNNAEVCHLVFASGFCFWLIFSLFFVIAPCESEKHALVADFEVFMNNGGQNMSCSSKTDLASCTPLGEIARLSGPTLVAYANEHASPLCRNLYGRYTFGLLSTDPPSFTHRWYFWVLFVPTLLAYFIQAFASPTNSYFSHIRMDLMAYLNQMTEAKPVFTFHIECYHLVEEKYTDSNGNRRTRQRSVITHTAAQNWTYSTSEDHSDTVSGSSLASVNRARLELEIEFGDQETADDYSRSFVEFVTANTRDTHRSVSSGREVPGFEINVLGYRDSATRKPALFSLGWFWLFTLILLSPLYQMYFKWLTHAHDHVVKKRVYSRSSTDTKTAGGIEI